MADSTINIRAATAADQDTIRQMVRAARLDRTQLHWSHFMIAAQAGEVVGIGQIRPQTPELGSLVVKQGWRGQGIGEQLIRTLLARQAGTIYLECGSSKVPYYERFGFVEVSWRDVPMPLKLKNLLGNLPGRLFGWRIAAMKYDNG